MKLLRRTVRSYLLYSLGVLLVAIPLFYFIISALCMQDVDEALQNRKRRLELEIKAHQEILSQLPWHDLAGEMAVLPPVSENVEEKKVTLQRYSTLSGEDEPYRELHTFIAVGPRIYPAVLRISLIDIEDLIQGIVLTELLLMIVILGGLLWINRRQTQRLWRPFYQTLDQLRHFKLNKPPAMHFAETDIEEFGDLQQAVHQLTMRNYKTYLQQKEFTENASHEMQTPLASFQARLEILMQDDSLTLPQSEHIQALSDLLSRMSKLNGGLLLLAKIENKQFSETQRIDLVSLIKTLLGQLEMQLRLKQLKIAESYQELVIHSNPVLMDILVSNLLTNAIQHAAPGGTVSIATFPGRLEIANMGNPLPFPEEKLFQRFQRGTVAHGNSGNGLGLAIVRQICDTCHFSIAYHGENGLHCFVLTF